MNTRRKFMFSGLLSGLATIIPFKHTKAIETVILRKKYCVEYYSLLNDVHVLHREDGPAIERASGAKFWFVNGERHREDGPAVENANGDKEWWINGKLHREDGPAVEWSHGSKEWWLNGKRHRDDGPAYMGSDGSKSWYLNDKKLTEEQFNRI